MREIIKRGDSAKKVIEEFLRENNLRDSDVEIIVEHKGSSGFLALFGKKEAVVKFIMPDVEDRLKDYLRNLLQLLNINYMDIHVKSEKNTYYTHVKGVDNPGFLIGKEGKMLASIELLLNKIVDDKDNRNDNVILDIDNYKRRQNVPNGNNGNNVKPPTKTDSKTDKSKKQEAPRNTPPKRKPVRRPQKNKLNTRNEQ